MLVWYNRQGVEGSGGASSRKSSTMSASVPARRLHRDESAVAESRGGEFYNKRSTAEQRIKTGAGW
jgi:hypothetical protein